MSKCFVQFFSDRKAKGLCVYRETKLKETVTQKNMYDNTFKGKIPYMGTTNKFKFVRGRRGLKGVFFSDK